MHFSFGKDQGQLLQITELAVYQFALPVRPQLTDLPALLQARVVGPLSPQTIEHLLVDSRELTAPAASLFFALPGRHTHGQRFIPDLYARGVRAFVVSQLPPPGCAEASFLLVDDVVAALQTLAAHYRATFDLPVVGITGSNGKTIVKEWLYQLLAPHFRTLRSPRSYNSQVGVPLSVWQLEPHHQLAIFEAGVSQLGDMAPLARIIRPTLGLFTNLGAAHDEGFPSRGHKLAEKIQLFAHCSTVFYCLDQPEVEAALGNHPGQGRCWSVHRPEADLYVHTMQRHARSTSLQARYAGQEYSLEAPFTDDISLENVVHCWLLLLYLGLPGEAIATGVARLAHLGLRLELKAGRQGCLLIDDTYSNDLTSLAAALNFAEQQAPHLRRTLVLSDLPESGLAPTELYPRVAGLLGRRFQRVIGVGPEMVRLGDYLPESVERHFFADTNQLLQQLDHFGFARELILLKGARAFGFERLSYRLAQQTHRTVLEISLSALAHNLNVFKAGLAPGVRLAAMVKAAAYGSGGAEVARVLELRGVDYLVVAYPDEGVELRQAGIKTPIMVLNAEPESFGLLAQHQLEGVVYGWAQLYELEALALPGRLHLKIDTGMHRLGFAPAEAAHLGGWLAQRPTLRVASVFTHLAASENPVHDPFTHQQVDTFQAACTILCTALGYQPLRHVLNSNGIARFGQYQFEMVRLGIGLYGVETAAWQAQLRPVLSLRARVAQVRDVPAHETVGYGRAGVLHRPSRIATLGIGYADGLPRACGYGRFAPILHGQPAPTVGAICMDMCMVDVTDIPQVREGDTATLFGQQPRVETLAAAANTIPYEIFTGIAGRVHRVYVED